MEVCGLSLDSPLFIFLCLPLVALVGLLVRNTRARNVILLIAGLFFYSFGSVAGLGILILSAAANFFFGLVLSKKASRAVLCAGIVLDLAALAVFKYFNILPGIAAPIGISFFTFKNISYLIDVYRDGKKRSSGFFSFLLYISFLPEVLSGPISRYSDFSAQLDERSVSLENTAAGLKRFIYGLAKKLIIAGTIGRVADAVFSARALDIRLAWLGAIAYSLQLFFDFAGYSDMAIGLGAMLGFRIRENFNYPYVAHSITEFWRRWHISLSSWFKDYLYIPLGGNRKGRGRAAINKFIVFTLCGVWHGAGLTFLLWGAWHGLLSALETLRIIDIDRLRRNAFGRVVSHVLAMLCVVIGFVMFRAVDVPEGLRVISAMFTGFSFSAYTTALLYSIISPRVVLLLITGVLLSAPVAPALGEKLPKAAAYAFSIVLLVISVAELAAGGFQPFIYMQF